MTFKYDVFISFRGDDTRYNFIGFLHKELFRKGISAFVDDNDLKMGQGISPSLSEAIEESKILLVVFSQNYASSTWSLDELVQIIDCSKRNNSKQLVFPIFYHVDPSHIRYQSNEYGKAMAKHKARLGEGSQSVQDWISALSAAANFPGEHITGVGYESKIIETIVERIFDNIPPKPLPVDQVPIGLEHHIEEVMPMLDMKPNDDSTVCMLGIYGTGGIGKTELAKALYNKIVHQFEAVCFLSNVREKSKNAFGMEGLQKTLMSDMLKEFGTGLLGSTCKGSGEIKRKLKHKMVLLVLDDVDETKQLDDLAGGCDWFGPGSRIIITTRNKKCLDQRVEHKYRMTELSEEHSLGLFCWNAFKQSHPAAGFEHVSSRAIRYAQGLPLALKVIGSDMATKERTLTAWETALKDYKKTEEYGRIQDVLKISYDSLKRHAQQVFLDIACFFKGEKIDYVKMILEEFNATSNIDLLVDKSLITVEHDCLMMHDLLQDMGREVVMQEKPNNPGERSRLWHWEDVIEVLTEDYASIEIQGIMLDPPERQKVDWSGTAFEKMKRLRILIVRNTSFLQEPKNLPNHLRVMDWEDYPGKSFPSEFHPKGMIIFNLQKSHLTLLKPFKKFSKLTKMNFSYSHSITEMPDVSEAPNIRELRLDNCKNLTTVHESVGFLQKLVHLSASECTKLRNFLQSMSLPSLELLDLNSCIGLEHFPEVVGKMDKPLKIYMIDTAIKELPDSIGKLTGLVSIELPCSKKLTNLPDSLFMLPNLVAIKIGGCYQLRESFRRFSESHLPTNTYPTFGSLHFENGGLSDEDLHAILKCFPKLEELVAWENNFVSLPTCIKKSAQLTTLDLSLCRKLRQIPECSALGILDVHGCVKLEYISELPSTTRKVDARHCFSLTRETSDMLWCQVSPLYL